MSEQTQIAAKAPSPEAAPTTSVLLQRKCACGGSSGLTGSCSDCEKKKLLGQPLQTKLRISEPGGEHEQEADRVAEQVVRMPDPVLEEGRGKNTAAPLVQRKVNASPCGIGVAPPIVRDVLASPGQPLDAATRAFFEPRFGHDFSHVRLHTDPGAAKAVNAISSHAFTVGQDVVIGPQKYAPATAEGRRLLAHELTHTIQQGAGSRSGNIIQRQENRNLAEADQALANTALLNTNLLKDFIIKRQTEKGIKLEGKTEVLDPEAFKLRYITYLMRPGHPDGPRINSKTNTPYNYAEATEKADSVGGFADGTKIVLKYQENSAVMLHNAIHEAIHQQSTVSGYKTLGFNVNEGTTEFLTRYVCRDQSLDCGSGEYEAQYQAVKDFVALVNLDLGTLAYAYFLFGEGPLKTAVGVEVFEAWKQGMKIGEGTSALWRVKRAIKKHGLPSQTSSAGPP
jgi:Domain of unknown function (DUF4157)